MCGRRHVIDFRLSHALTQGHWDAESQGRRVRPLNLLPFAILLLVNIASQKVTLVVASDILPQNFENGRTYESNFVQFE